MDNVLHILLHPTPFAPLSKVRVDEPHIEATEEVDLPIMHVMYGMHGLFSSSPTPPACGMLVSSPANSA